MRAALVLRLAVVCAGQSPKVVSPEIDGKRRVTFRLHAPSAEKVRLWGEWIHTFNTMEELTRNDAGTWAVTVGPLAPGIYCYTFNVDGVAALDLRNPLRSASQRLSMVEVPGPTPALYDPRSVPHGEVRHHWLDSPDFSRQRVVVYVPPGYE